MRTLALMFILSAQAFAQYGQGNIYNQYGQRVGGYSYDTRALDQALNSALDRQDAYERWRREDEATYARLEQMQAMRQQSNMMRQQVIMNGGQIPNAMGGVDVYAPGGQPLYYTFPDGNGGWTRVMANPVKVTLSPPKEKKKSTKPQAKKPPAKSSTLPHKPL